MVASQEFAAEMTDMMPEDGQADRGVCRQSGLHVVLKEMLDAVVELGLRLAGCARERVKGEFEAVKQLGEAGYFNPGNNPLGRGVFRHSISSNVPWYRLSLASL